MTMLQFVLSTLIRNGKVTVEIPDVSMDELRQAVDTRAVRMMEEARDIVWADEMTDTEKVELLQQRLELE